MNRTEPATAPPFSQLPLSAAALANLEQLGYLGMTPVQAAALPIALAGHDLIAQAKTGSGKTAAFALALLNRLKLDDPALELWRGIRATGGASPGALPHA